MLSCPCPLCRGLCPSAADAVQSTPFRMNDACREPDPSNGDPCVGAIRWPRGRGLAVRPAFDDRGIALEAPQRRLADGVEQPHGDFGEPAPARRRVGPLAASPEHRDGADRLAALPEQVRRGVPSGAGCAGILNPGGLRRLGDVRGGLGETACGRFPPWLPASEAPSISPVPAEGGGRFQERCRRLAGLRTRIGPIRSLHAPAGLTTCRLCGIKRETRTPGRRSPGAPGSGLAPELRKDSPPAAGGADSGLQGFAGIRDRTGLARAFRAFRPAGIFPAAVSLPFAARAPRLSPKEDVESDSWQFFRLRSQRATAAANGRFAQRTEPFPEFRLAFSRWSWSVARNLARLAQRSRLTKPDQLTWQKSAWRSLTMTPGRRPWRTSARFLLSLTVPERPQFAWTAENRQRFNVNRSSDPVLRDGRTVLRLGEAVRRLAQELRTGQEDRPGRTVPPETRPATAGVAGSSRSAGGTGVLRQRRRRGAASRRRHRVRRAC